MTVASLEFRRAQRLLEAFCQRRNALDGRTALACREQGDSLLLVSSGAHGNPERALVKLHYRERRWAVFWPREDGSWQPWPHLPETDRVQFILDELEQAPLHVHW